MANGELLLTEELNPKTNLPVKSKVLSDEVLDRIRFPQVDSYKRAAFGVEGQVVLDPEKFDFQLKVGADNQELRAQHQSVGEQTLHGIGRLGGTFITKAMEGFGFLGGGIGALLTQDIDVMTKNSWVEFWENAEEGVKEKLPIYHTRKYLDNNIWTQLGTWSFWMDDFVDGLAFMASAYVPGIGLAKIGSIGAKGAKLYAGLARTFNKSLTAARVGKGVSGASLNRLATKIDWTNAFMLQTSVEAGFEARDTQLEVERDLESQTNPKTGLTYTPQEIKEISSRAAASVYRGNMIALAPSNALEQLAVFKGFRGFKNIISGVVKDPKKFLKPLTIGEYAKAAGVGMFATSLAEGPYEENIQLAMQDYYHDVAVGKVNTDFISGIAGNFFNNFTTDEGQKSIVLGSLIGLIPGGVGGIRDIKRLRKEGIEISDQIEFAKNSYQDKITEFLKRGKDEKIIIKNGRAVVDRKALESTLKKMATEKKTLDHKILAAIRNDEESFKLLSDREFSALALGIIRIDGGIDHLIDFIDDNFANQIKNLPTIIQERDDEGNPLTIEQIKTKYKERAREMQEVYDNIPYTEPGQTGIGSSKEAYSFLSDFKLLQFYHGITQSYLNKRLKELNIVKDKRNGKYRPDNDILDNIDLAVDEFNAQELHIKVLEESGKMDKKVIEAEKKKLEKRGKKIDKLYQVSGTQEYLEENNIKVPKDKRRTVLKSKEKSSSKDILTKTINVIVQMEGQKDQVESQYGEVMDRKNIKEQYEDFLSELNKERKKIEDNVKEASKAASTPEESDKVVEESGEDVKDAEKMKEDVKKGKTDEEEASTPDIKKVGKFDLDFRNKLLERYTTRADYLFPKERKELMQRMNIELPDTIEMFVNGLMEIANTDLALSKIIKDFYQERWNKREETREKIGETVTDKIGDVEIVELPFNINEPFGNKEDIDKTEDRKKVTRVQSFQALVPFYYEMNQDERSGRWSTKLNEDGVPIPRKGDIGADGWANIPGNLKEDLNIWYEVDVTIINSGDKYHKELVGNIEKSKTVGAKQEALRNYYNFYQVLMVHYIDGNSSNNNKNNRKVLGMLNAHRPELNGEKDYNENIKGLRDDIMEVIRSSKLKAGLFTFDKTTTIEEVYKGKVLPKKASKKTGTLKKAVKEDKIILGIGVKNSDGIITLKVPYANKKIQEAVKNTTFEKPGGVYLIMNAANDVPIAMRLETVRIKEVPGILDKVMDIVNDIDKNNLKQKSEELSNYVYIKKDIRGNRLTLSIIKDTPIVDLNRVKEWNETTRDLVREYFSNRFFQISLKKVNQETYNEDIDKEGRLIANVESGMATHSAGFIVSPYVEVKVSGKGKRRINKKMTEAIDALKSVAQKEKEDLDSRVKSQKVESKKPITVEKRKSVKEVIKDKYKDKKRKSKGLEDIFTKKRELHRPRELKRWNKEGELKWFNERFPGVPVHVLETLRNIAGKGGSDAYGAMVNAIVYLRDNNVVGTTYHEAFHLVFNYVLTDDQQKQIYLEGLGTYKEQLEGLGEVSDIKKLLNKEKLDGQEEDRLYPYLDEMEEFMAEDFIEYVINDGKEVKGLGQQIIDFFKKLYYLLKSYITDSISINEIFYRTQSKMYARVKFRKNISKFQNIRKFKLIDDFTDQQLEKRIRVINNKLFEKVEEYRKKEKNKFLTESDIIRKYTLDRLYEEVYNDIDGLLYDLWIHQEKNLSVQEKKDVDNAVEKLSLIIENSEFYEGYKREDKEGLFALAKKGLIEYNYITDTKDIIVSSSEDESEGTENPHQLDDGKRKEESWQKNVLKTSRKESVSVRIKIFLKGLSLRKINPKDGQSYRVSDDTGVFDEYLPYDEIYPYLLENLSNIHGNGEFFDKLEELSGVRSELKLVVERLDKDSALKTDFYTHFSSQGAMRLTLKEHVRELPSDVTVHTYRVSDTNRRDIRAYLHQIWKTSMLYTNEVKIHSVEGKEEVWKLDEKSKKNLKNLQTAYKRYALKLRDVKEITLSHALSLSNYLASIGIDISAETLFKEYRETKEDSAKDNFTSLVSGVDSIEDLIIHLSEGRSPFVREKIAVMNRLADIVKRHDLHKATSSFMNINNETEYTYILPNHISKVFAGIKGKDFESYIDGYTDKAFYSDHLWLNQLRGRPGLRENFKYALLNGMIRDKWNKGKAPKEMGKVDIEIAKLNLYFNNGNKDYAWFAVPNLGDSPASLFIQYGHMTDTFEKETEDGMYKVYLQEYKSIKRWKEDKRMYLSDKFSEDDLVKNFHYLGDIEKLEKKDEKIVLNGQGNRYMILKFLNKVDIENEESVREAIRDHLQKKYDGYVNHLVRLGILVKRGDRYMPVPGKLNNRAIKQGNFIKRFYYNSFLANIQITTLFANNPAYYTDLPKRIKEIWAMGEVSNTEEMGSAFNQAILKDNMVTSLYLKEIKEGLKAAGLKMEKQRAIVALYDNDLINETDSMTFIRLDRKVKYMKSHNEWSIEHEEALKDIENGNPTKENLRVFLSPEKSFYFGNTDMNGVLVPIQRKNAEMWLSKEYAYKSKKLKAIYDRMNLEEDYSPGAKYNKDSKLKFIDALDFESVVKVGVSGALKLSDDFSNLKDIKIMELENSNVLRQQVIPEHHIDEENVFSIQIRRMIIEDLLDDTEYDIKDWKSLDKEKLISLYQDIISVNISGSLKTLNGEINNISKITDILLKKVRSLGLGGRHEEALELKIDKLTGKQKPKQVLYSPTTGKKNEQILSSLHKHNVIRQKIKGINAVQFSSFGYSDILKPMRYENGKVLPAEILLPWWTKEYYTNPETGEVDIKDIPDNLLEMIGYRIPTEGKHSMLYMKVIGFLPKEMGSVVIVPTEITTIADSDFDIDKLFIMLPEFKVGTLQGKKFLTKVNYDYSIKTEEQSRAARNNAIIDLMVSVLSNVKHYGDHWQSGGKIYDNKENKLVAITDYAERMRTLRKAENMQEADFFDPITQTELSVSSNTGVTLISNLVNHRVFHSVAQVTKLSMSNNISFDGENKMDMSAINNVDNEHIARIFGLLEVGALDNVKKPTFYDLNINRETVDILSMIIHTGYKLETGINFINQPAVRRLTESLLNNMYNPLETVKKRLESILEKDEFPPEGYLNLKTKDMEKMIKFEGENKELVNKFLGMKDKMTDDEIKKLKDFSIYQLEVLENFMSYRAEAKDLSSATLSIKVDSINNAIGSTLMETTSNIESLKNVIKNGRVQGIENIFPQLAFEIYEEQEELMANDDSVDRNVYERFKSLKNVKSSYPFLDRFLKDGQQASQKFMSEHFPWMNRGFKEIRKRILSNTSRSVMTSGEANLVNDHLLTYIISGHDFFYDMEPKKENTIKKRLFKGDNNIVTRLIKKINEDDGFKTEAFIERLVYDLPIKDDNIYASVDFWPHQLNDSERKQVSRSIERILREEYGEDSIELMRDLIRYMYYRHGLSYKTGSFMYLVPQSFWDGIRLDEYLEKEVDASKNSDTFYEDFIPQFFRNTHHTEWLNFIPVIDNNNVSEKVFYGDFNLTSVMVDAKKKPAPQNPLVLKQIIDKDEKVKYIFPYVIKGVYKGKMHLFQLVGQSPDRPKNTTAVYQVIAGLGKKGEIMEYHYQHTNPVTMNEENGFSVTVVDKTYYHKDMNFNSIVRKIKNPGSLVIKSIPMKAAKMSRLEEYAGITEAELVGEEQTIEERQQELYEKLERADYSSIIKFVNSVELSKSPFYFLYEIADKLGVKIVFRGLAGSTAGYFRKYRAIIINSKKELYGTKIKQGIEEILTHEILHSIIHNKEVEIGAKQFRESDFYKDLKKLSSELQSIARIDKNIPKRLVKIIEHIKKDPEELITFAFSNKDFARWLNEESWSNLKNTTLSFLKKEFNLSKVKLDGINNILDGALNRPMAPIESLEEEEEENENVRTVYQGYKGKVEMRKYNYFSLSEEEAKDYGEKTREVKIDTTGFLDAFNNEKEYRNLTTQFKDKTGDEYDHLNNSIEGLEIQKEFFKFLEEKGYRGLDYTGYSDSQYIITFDKDSILDEKFYKLSSEGTGVSKEEADKELNDRLLRFIGQFGVTQEMVDNMKERLGIDAMAAANIFEKIIYVSKGKMDIKTIPEEVAHFYLELLGENNPLYKRMMGLVGKTEKYQEVVERYSDQYNGDETKLKKESMGQIISDIIVEQWKEKNKTLWRKITDTVKLIINRIKLLFNKADEDQIQREVNAVFGEASSRILEGDTTDLALKNLEKSLPGETFLRMDKDRDVYANYEELLAKSQEIIRNKIIIAKEKHRIGEIKELESLFKKLEKGTLQGRITSLTSNILDSTTKIIEEFEELKKSGFETMSVQETARFLNKARNSILSYRPIVTDMIHLVNEGGEDVIKESKKLLEKLAKIQEQLGIFDSSYYLESLSIVQKFLQEFAGDRGDGKNINLYNKLRSYDKDISMTQHVLDSMAESLDDVLKLLDKAMKSSKREGRVNTQEAVRDLLQSWESLKKTGINDQDWVYEKYKGKYTRYFISKYNMGHFDEEKDKFWEAVDKHFGDKPLSKGSEKWKQRNRVIFKWYNENTVPNSKAKEIIEKNRESMSEEDFEAWHSQSVRAFRKKNHANYEMMTETRYKGRVGELVLPSDKYLNKDFSKITGAKAEFYTSVMNVYMDAQKMIDYRHRRGMLAPQIYKDFMERVTGGTLYDVKQVFTEAYQRRIDDELYGAQDESGRPVKTLPIFYTGKIKNVNDMSKDVIATVSSFYYMASDYNQMNKILDLMELSSDLLERRVEVNKGEKDALSRLKEIAGINQGETRGSKRFKIYMDMQLYGHKLKKQELAIGGFKVTEKHVQLFNKYVALNALALNIFSGISNVTFGNVMIRAEAVGGQIINSKDLWVGRQNYWKELPRYLSEIGEVRKTSKSALWLEDYDTMQDYSASLREASSIRKTKIGNLFRQSTLFATNHIGEHYMQGGMAFAVANTVRFNPKDKSWIHRREFFKGKPRKLKKLDFKLQEVWRTKEKEWDSMVTLWDARIVKDGELVFKKEYEGTFTKRDRDLYENRTNFINKRLHGIYNEVDRSIIQQYVLGQTAILFRKWMKPGWNRRWEWRNYNEEGELWIEGNYITTGRFIGNLFKDLEKFGVQTFSENWDKLEDYEVANIRKTLIETGYFIASLTLIGALSQIDMDDDDWIASMSLYQAYRLRTELIAFVWIGEAWRLIDSPIAGMSTLNNMKSLLEIWSWFDVYERGPYKDRFHITKSFLTAIPFYKTVDKELSPEKIREAITYYK